MGFDRKLIMVLEGQRLHQIDDDAVAAALSRLGFVVTGVLDDGWEGRVYVVRGAKVAKIWYGAPGAARFWIDNANKYRVLPRLFYAGHVDIDGKELPLTVVELVRPLELDDNLNITGRPDIDAIIDAVNNDKQLPADLTPDLTTFAAGLAELRADYGTDISPQVGMASDGRWIIYDIE